MGNPDMRMTLVTGLAIALAAMGVGACGTELPPAWGPAPDADTDADGDSDSDADTDECVPPDGPVPFVLPAGGDPGLIQAEDCDQVADGLRQRILERLERPMEALREDMVQRKLNPDLCGSGDADTDMDADGDGDSDWDTDPGGDPEGADEYSTTNNQEDGVDEADFVKNDGSYIYLLADGRFQILDAWPPEAAHRISATPLEGEPRKMFVHDGKAVIYSSMPAASTGDPAFAQAAWSECTYGFDCELVGDGRPLRIAVYDLADLAAPQLIREIETEGSLLAARRVGGTAYTTVVYPEPMDVTFDSLGLALVPAELQPYQWMCGDDIPFSVCEIEVLFAELLLENRGIIAAMDPNVALPQLTDRRLVGEEWVEQADLFEGCGGFWLSAAADGLNQISLLSFDPAVQEDISATSILGRPGAVYASAESLYVAARHVPQDGEDWFFSDPWTVPEATTVHKFALDPAAMTSEYRGSAAVEGRVLNQFSMSEREGYLRVATATGFSPNAYAHGTVSVLAQEDAGLVVVGQVDQIAPSEDTRAVRFVGDRGYVVTFKVETGDPLFVLDLADPTTPQIAGELHIPGFSTYVHPLDADHLLTIGYEAESFWEEIDGISLQIFDVSDPSDPVTAHKHVIGTAGTSSEAATNHLAFNYFPSRDQLAIPITVCDFDGADWGMTFSGLQVYDVTAEDGFSLIGGLAHADPVSGDDYFAACGGFWTDGTSAVKRSIFMDEYVYSIAPELVLAAAVSDLESPLASIDLTAP